jgi:predicted enzyme related to lactoylglutathione lyase
MPEVTKHEPGAFSWAELATSDSAGAKAFYTKLFDWSFMDSPAGPDMIYTTLQKGGKSVGALYQQGAQETGMPPHWNAYFTVKSADETAKKAAEAGGKLAMAPFDVMTFGSTRRPRRSMRRANAWCRMRLTA